MDTEKVLSRRAFLRAGALVAAGLAGGCIAPTPSEDAAPGTTYGQVDTATPSPAPTHTPPPTATPAPTLTATPMPTNTAPPTYTAGPTLPSEPRAKSEPTQTPAPTNTPEPTATPLVATPARADLLSHYPQAAQSAVSLVRHDGVWDGDQILEGVVLQMLDAALTQLTGVSDALSAWQALFDRGEIVGIKVNTISRYTTTPQVAYAVAQRLQEAGIPAEQIVLFDRSDRELRDRGFQLNDGGPGVQCRGAKAWEHAVDVAGVEQRIHDVMLSCDALINIPPLKDHGTSGFTSAMKNHYGTISAPGRLHGNDCDPFIPELNGLPIIRDKTRLIVGDFLRTCPYNWNQMTKENVIAMSFDPVAHDTVARQMLVDRRQADGRPGKYIEGRSHYLDTAFALGLGADAAHAEVLRTTLG